MFQFFEILILSRDSWGNVYHIREINLIFSWNLIKAFYLPNETNWKKFETRFCRRKTAEDDNAKINISSNIPVPFCSSKPVHFFKYSLREKQVLSFALLDKWNVNNSVEKMKIYFSIVFYDDD